MTNNLDASFAALSDPTRRAVIERLPERFERRIVKRAVRGHDLLFDILRKRVGGASRGERAVGYKARAVVVVVVARCGDWL